MMDLVDLSYNNIYKFSDWLLFISWCTDLSANKIVTIPGKKKFKVISTTP